MCPNMGQMRSYDHTIVIWGVNLSSWRSTGSHYPGGRLYAWNRFSNRQHEQYGDRVGSSKVYYYTFRDFPVKEDRGRD